MDAGKDDASERDAAFHARLQSAFAAAGGQGDVTDELWWREQPGRPHPAGVRDPALDREVLIEAAYSKAESAQDSAVASAELHAFETHRSRQRDALDAALALTPRRVPRRPVAGTPETAPTPRPGFLRRHRVAVPVAALVVAVALGAAAAITVVSLENTGTPSARPTSISVEASGSTVLTRALARVQVPTDALPDALRGAVDVPSSRLLYDDDPSEGMTGHRWRLWMGTGENLQQLCFVTTFDNVADTVTCLPRRAALANRFIVSQTTSDGRFEALVDDGAVAVQVG